MDHDPSTDNRISPSAPDDGAAAPGAGRRSFCCSSRRDQICTLPNGRKLTIRQLADRLGLTYGVLFRELLQAEWQIEEILLKYPKRSILCRRVPEVPGDP